MTARLCVLIGALALAVAVATGAFGAHALRTRLSAEMLAVWATAVQYHFWHALGLLAIGVLMTSWSEPALLRVAAWLLLAGIVLFSGSLYLLAATGVRGLGAVAPFGGIALIGGWLALAWAAWLR